MAMVRPPGDRDVGPGGLDGVVRAIYDDSAPALRTSVSRPPWRLTASAIMTRLLLGRSGRYVGSPSREDQTGRTVAPASAYGAIFGRTSPG